MSDSKNCRRKGSGSDRGRGVEEVPRGCLEKIRHKEVREGQGGSGSRTWISKGD